MDLLDLPPRDTHPSAALLRLEMLPGWMEKWIGPRPPSTAWAQPVSSDGLSGVIEKVLFIQKSTIPDSIKLQTNEEAGKKKLFDYSIYWRQGRWFTYEL